MFELLKKSFADKVSMSPAELETLRDSFSPKKLRKRQYLLQEGDVCNRLAFVEQGALLSYSIDARGTQHVIQFGARLRSCRIRGTCNARMYETCNV